MKNRHLRIVLLFVFVVMNLIFFLPACLTKFCMKF